MNLGQHFPMISTQMNGKRLAYLDSAATALKPVSVAQTMSAYLNEHTSNVHRGIYSLSEDNTRHYEVVRDQVKDFLNAAAREEIIFTKGTTDAINLVAASWGRTNINAGDEIIISELEHHANIVPWQMLRDEKNAKLLIIPIKDDGSLDYQAFEKLLSARTKLVALSMVSNTTGVITDMAEVQRILKNKNITLLLDAAQAAPHFPLDVQSLGADFLCFSAHKVYGPTGVGVLWGKQSLLEAMPPYQGGGNMISTVTFEKTTWNKLPEKFEAGTPAIAEVLGFGAALEFVAEIGFPYIEKRDQELLNLATKKLLDIPTLRLFGTHPKKVATFAFEIPGLHPQDLGSVLNQEGVAIRTGHHCTQPLLKRFGVTAAARASFGLYNTEQDIDQLVMAIKKAQKLFL
ncbi:MAG: SufS family cysteine desulfurase [Proteobacteria bacterium]|jgi:cysteine desulfurase/selenocysteine lyase|nr:SufS family cysteine desulfurase [Pseudomonadota bacterium]